MVTPFLCNFFVHVFLCATPSCKFLCSRGPRCTFTARAASVSFAYYFCTRFSALQVLRASFLCAVRPCNFSPCKFLCASLSCASLCLFSLCVQVVQVSPRKVSGFSAQASLCGLSLQLFCANFSVQGVCVCGQGPQCGSVPTPRPPPSLQRARGAYRAQTVSPQLYAVLLRAHALEYYILSHIISDM